MGMYIKMDCACGATRRPVDIYDLDSNGYGNDSFVCSDACKSIWDTRVLWSAEFDYDYALAKFGCNYPLPTFNKYDRISA